MNMNITVNSEEELNQTMQQYLMKGYTLESKFNNMVVLKKKGYNTFLLIILLILGIILGIIYYLVCSDDKIFIELKYNQQTTQNISNESIEGYCKNCNAEIKKGNKFCTNCGEEIKDNIIKEEDKRYCENCGTLINEGNKFCRNCGEEIKNENNDILKLTE